MMRRNILREKLRADEPTIGTRLHSQWPTIIELVGLTKTIDYVEILAEYAPYDLFSLENIGRAIDLHEHMSGMIKIGQEMRMHLATRAANSGIQNMLFADIRSVEDAIECVQAVRSETPRLGGLRGAAQGRDVSVILEGGSEAYVQSTEDAVVALMIEKKEAIENLEAILDVKGVDMVQFGRVDYSVSVGLVGQKFHESVKEAERYMIQTALRKGIAPRVEIGRAEDAEYYRNLGVKDFSLGVDVSILFTFFTQEGSRLVDILKS